MSDSGKKRLVITYGGVTLYDDEPESFSWSEQGKSVEVKAGPLKANALAALIAQGSQRKPRTPLKSVDSATQAQ